MRAAIYRDGRILVGSYPDPAPDRGQVLVKTLACGICGSDLHFRQHAHAFVDVARRAGAPFVMNLDADIVLGHEFCAEILDYHGNTARRFTPGTRVCSVPTAHWKRQSRTIGLSNELPGGFGEYMALDASMLLEVPERLPSSHAALTEPLAVGWHAARVAQLEPGEAPLVVGCGPIGLAVVAALRVMDVRPVIAADFSPVRRRLAEQMGADEVVDPAAVSPYEGKDCSVVFECVGKPGMIQEVMASVRSGSRIVVVGACMQADTIEPMLGIYKALTLRFSLAYSAAEFAHVLDLLANGAIDVSPMITGRIALEEVPAAFHELATPDRHAKVVVEPWR